MAIVILNAHTCSPLGPLLLLKHFSCIGSASHSSFIGAAIIVANRPICRKLSTICSRPSTTSHGNSCLTVTSVTRPSAACTHTHMHMAAHLQPTPLGCAHTVLCVHHLPACLPVCMHTCIQGAAWHRTSHQLLCMQLTQLMLGAALYVTTHSSSSLQVL